MLAVVAVAMLLSSAVWAEIPTEESQALRELRCALRISILEPNCLQIPLLPWSPPQPPTRLNGEPVRVERFREEGSLEFRCLGLPLPAFDPDCLDYYFPPRPLPLPDERREAIHQS
jgi:hypothetical protein